MVGSYKTKGYDVILDEGTPAIKIVPNFIFIDFGRTLTLKKMDESNVYSSFELNLKSNLHDMLEVAKNIIIWEINVGDSLPEAYSFDNPYLKVEKHRKADEVKIYVLTDKKTEEVFRFAVRSFAAPVGF